AQDGASHTSLFGVTDGGRSVFVKVETDPGRLATEAAALAWAARHAIAVPAVIGHGVAKVDDVRKVVLITGLVPDGTRPIDPAGWRRMGTALAKLAAVPLDGCPLRFVSNEQFACEHTMKLDAVRHLLPKMLATHIEQAIDRTRNPAFTPAFTHGDPGGGNFLDTATGGVLLDWETASVSPFGLDFGRAHFIARLDIQCTGNGGSLARAVRDGYLSDVRGLTLSGEDPYTWTTVAGLQFIHKRWTQRGRAGIRNYVDAIEVLKEMDRTR
ncbi:MAG: aminoglycoside phosphotransferase family protein, partial [Steroidobacteraceae bacterium]